MREQISKYFNFENFCFIFSITVYVVFTLFIISTRTPFFDEVNAWNIAQNCSFSELLQVSRHEGHFLLWYILIKPFAEHNIGFPVSMFVINWIIAFSAVLILWLKAPFNPLIKTFITFSLPVQMFSIYARCYSIGMLILFILCALYKKRFKHPIIYSFLIILLANTSVIGSLIAFVFGTIYFIDAIISLYKKEVEYKTIFQVISIFILGVMLALAQLAFSVVPTYSNPELRLFKFNEFFVINAYRLRDCTLVFLSFIMLCGWCFFKKNIRIYLFLLLSNFSIIFFGFKIFTLAPWHYLFLFINCIVTVWIYLSANEIKTIPQKILYVIFSIMCFCLVFYWGHNWYWNGLHIPTTNYIEQNIKEYENSNIFLYPTDSSIIGIVPSLRKYNINFYDAKGFSYRDYKLYVNQWSGINENSISLKDIEKVILSDTNKNNYLFVQTVEEFKMNFEFFDIYIHENPSNLQFSYYKKLPDAMIYKIDLKI